MIIGLLALVAFSSCGGEKSQDNSSAPVGNPGGGAGDLESQPVPEPEK